MENETHIQLSNSEIEQVLSGLKIRVSETHKYMKENKGFIYNTREVNRQRRTQEHLIMKLRHELKYRKIASENIDHD